MTVPYLNSNRNVASYLQSNSSQEKTLKERFSEIYPIHAQDVRQFVKEHGKTKLAMFY